MFCRLFYMVSSFQLTGWRQLRLAHRTLTIALLSAPIYSQSPSMRRPPISSLKAFLEADRSNPVVSPTAKLLFALFVSHFWDSVHDEVRPVRVLQSTARHWQLSKLDCCV